MPTSRLRRSRALPLLLLVSSASAFVVTPALGQAPADPTLQAAHERFAEGIAFFDKGDFERARASFLQAYALHKHPAVLMNLAQSSLRSGHFLDADHYFFRYLHESSSLTPAQRSEAEKGLADSRLKVGRLDISAPAGAAIVIDGDTLAADAPQPVDVEPGSHTVKAGDDSSTVSVTAGQTVPVKLGKSKVAAAPIAPIEPAPPAPEPPPAEPAPTPAPEPAKAAKASIFTPPENMTPVWIGVSAGVAGFATAIIFGVFESSAQSSYNNEASAIMGASSSAHPCKKPTAGSQIATACNELNSDASDGNADAAVADVGLAVGLVGIGLAGVWYFVAPKPKPHDGSASWLTHVSPVAARDGGGLRVSF